MTPTEIFAAHLARRGAGDLWLYLRANPGTLDAHKKSEGEIEEGVREGARKLIHEDLGAMTLEGKLGE